MPVETLRASYILRLTQRLSRLSFELRDVRTGCLHRFDNAGALSRFLDARVTERSAAAANEDEAAAAMSGLRGSSNPARDNPGERT